MVAELEAQGAASAQLLAAEQMELAKFQHTAQVAFFGPLIQQDSVQ